MSYSKHSLIYNEDIFSERFLKPIQQRQGAAVSINNHSLVDFSSNDTLSLSTNTELLQQFNQTSFEQFGSTGSRLLSGDTIHHHQLESQLSQWLNKPHALLFNSGFQLNSGLFKTLLNQNDVVFADKFCHASIIDGLLASPAKVYRYKHNDMSHLHTLLTTHRNQFQSAMIVTESIFSMDGNQADLETLTTLKRQFNTTLYVDDAHGIGLYGPQGQGACYPHLPDIDYLIGTFGKAFGGFGAFLACDHTTYHQVINHCRSFIYSTALPIPVILWNQHALQWIQSHRHERTQVATLSAQLRQGFQELGLSTRGTTHIVPLLFKEDSITKEISILLQENDIYALPIFPPTVPKNQSRLRFSLTCSHTSQDIQNVIDHITQYLHS